MTFKKASCKESAILTPQRTGYMPQLDGLRALAVIAVLCHHYLPRMNLNLWALAGVKLFFVLSGFLITGILLHSREVLEKSKQKWQFAVRQFYIRRFLRIFPLYYFVILIAVLINLEPVRQILPWLMTYTLNIYMAYEGWYVAHFAHFWTLAVEEQFYILWPWFVLLAPRKALIPLCILFILLGPLYRFWTLAVGFAGLGTYLFTPACLDTLCMGALLAMLHSAYSAPKIRHHLKQWVLPLGASVAAILAGFGKGEMGSKIDTVFFDFSLALLFCWLIHSAAEGFPGVAGTVLESKPLTYIGKISYGIYVYHPFTPYLCQFLFKQAGWDYPAAGWLSFMVPAAVTLALASLSWYLMEQPFNNLKRHFKDDAGLPVLPDPSADPAMGYSSSFLTQDSELREG